MKHSKLSLFIVIFLSFSSFSYAFDCKRVFESAVTIIASELTIPGYGQGQFKGAYDKLDKPYISPSYRQELIVLAENVVTTRSLLLLKKLAQKAGFLTQQNNDYLIINNPKTDETIERRKKAPTNAFITASNWILLNVAERLERAAEIYAKIHETNERLPHFENYITSPQVTKDGIIIAETENAQLLVSHESNDKLVLKLDEYDPIDHLFFEFIWKAVGKSSRLLNASKVTIWLKSYDRKAYFYKLPLRKQNGKLQETVPTSTTFDDLLRILRGRSFTFSTSLGQYRHLGEDYFAEVIDLGDRAFHAEGKQAKKLIEQFAKAAGITLQKATWTDKNETIKVLEVTLPRTKKEFDEATLSIPNRAKSLTPEKVQSILSAIQQKLVAEAKKLNQIKERAGDLGELTNFAQLDPHITKSGVIVFNKGKGEILADVRNPVLRAGLGQSAEVLIGVAVENYNLLQSEAKVIHLSFDTINASYEKARSIWNEAQKIAGLISETIPIKEILITASNVNNPGGFKTEYLKSTTYIDTSDSVILYRLHAKVPVNTSFEDLMNKIRENP